jgi:hypothetical protein
MIITIFCQQSSNFEPDFCEMTSNADTKQQLVARVKILEKQLEESKQALTTLWQDQQATDSFFQHRIRAAMSRHMPRKRHYRKTRSEEEVNEIIPPNVFSRLFPNTQRASASTHKRSFQTLDELERDTGISSRLHKKADDACTK